ncbi:hypothetical protein Tco_1038818 [Tanacetum coccineum]
MVRIYNLRIDLVDFADMALPPRDHRHRYLRDIVRRLFKIRGPLVHELILEFFSTFKFKEVVLDLDTAGAL